MYDRGTIHIMISNTMGSATQTDNQNGTDRDAVHATLFADPWHVMGSGFATGQSELIEHDNGDELAGSHMGATGTFTCAADNCTSRRTANGIQLAGTAAWSLVPIAISECDPDVSRNQDRSAVMPGAFECQRDALMRPDRM